MRIYTSINANELKESMFISFMAKHGTPVGNRTFITDDEPILDIDISPSDFLKGINGYGDSLIDELVGAEGLLIVNSVSGDGSEMATHVVNSKGAIHVGNYIDNITMNPSDRSVRLMDTLGKMFTGSIESLLSTLSLLSLANISKICDMNAMLGMGYIKTVNDDYNTAIVAGGIDISKIEGSELPPFLLFLNSFSRTSGCDLFSVVKGYGMSYDEYVSGIVSTMSLKMADRLLDNIEFLILSIGYDISEPMDSVESRELTEEMIRVLDGVAIKSMNHRKRIENIGVSVHDGTGRDLTNPVQWFDEGTPIEDRFNYIDSRCKYVH